MSNVQPRHQAHGTGSTEVTVSFDALLPLATLSPESFEYFSLDFLTTLYRGEAKVHQAGKTGHKQHGIDLEANFIDGARLTFQCKREAQFGPAKVRAAINAQTISAKKKYILLSRVASPGARKEVKKARGWDIWDQSDITQRFRTLPKSEQIRIVDTFFPSQRFALTGQMEPGPWLAVTDFFAPQLVQGRIFNHRWELVGRSPELDHLTQALTDRDVVVTSLVGPAGGGKSRLLRSVLECFSAEQPHIRIVVASPTEEIDAKGLEDLGTGEKLLVVDDAHDRDDLNQLIRYAADERNNTQLLLVYRPYWVDVIRGEMAREGLTGKYIRLIVLPKPTKKDATELASQVLKEHGTSTKLAAMIAETAYDSPLAVVVGAQIVAKDGVHPELFGSNEEFNATVLKRYEQVVTNGIAQGKDRDRVGAMLRVLALVQPVIPDDNRVIELLRKMEGIDAPDATRIARLLIDSGVLFKRGRLYRLSPDLLADSVIERSCITSSGESNGYAERLFYTTIPEHKEHILLNLGRLDWRRNKGNTSTSRLLDELWSGLKWKDDYLNAYVKAAASAAYFQPRQALEFARQLVDQGHGRDENVCRIIRNAAYNLTHLLEACDLLWEIGKADARPMHSNPYHPLRLLIELATPEPKKPISYCETVVEFGLSLVPFEDSWIEVATPFDILKGALATEGHTSEAASRSFVFTPYGVNPKAVAPMRQRIIAMILDSLISSRQRQAFAAAKLLENALSGPIGIMSRKPSDAEHAEWYEEFADTLSRVNAVVEINILPAVVLIRLGQSVSRFTRSHENAFSKPAEGILAKLDRDLETQLVRILMDGWGHSAWPYEQESYNHNFQRQELLAQKLEAAFPNPANLARFLEERVLDLKSYHEDILQSAHIFLNRIIESQVALAQEVFEIGECNPHSSLAEYIPSALSSLLKNEPSEAHKRIRLLLEKDQESLSQIARAYAMGGFRGRQIDEFDQAVLRQIYCSDDVSVLRSTSPILREVAEKDQQFAIELIAHANPVLVQATAGDIFIWLDDDQFIPFDSISEEELVRILQLLATPNNLDNHFILSFLKRAIERYPRHVLNLAKRRLNQAISANDWTYKAIGIDNKSSLNLLKTPEGGILFQEVLDWALSNSTDNQFLYQFPDMVVGLFGFDSPFFASTLESWATGGTEAHFTVLAALLEEAPSSFALTEHTFVLSILRTASSVGKSTYKKIRSALLSSSLNGDRSGLLGQPYPIDVEMKERSEQLLSSINKTDPAYDFYIKLRSIADRNIERALAEGQALDEEDA